MEKKIFSKTIPVARPWFSEEEEAMVVETIRSGWVAQGPRVRAFEQAIADYVGVSFAVATNCGEFVSAPRVAPAKVFPPARGDPFLIQSSPAAGARDRNAASSC